MTLLSSHQRAVIASDTGIDRLIVDRATEAFDAVIDRGDVDAYTKLMSTAIVQMGFERDIKPEDRPTAVDKIKTILIHAYADKKHITFLAARNEMRERLQG